MTFAGPHPFQDPASARFERPGVLRPARPELLSWTVSTVPIASIIPIASTIPIASRSHLDHSGRIHRARARTAPWRDSLPGPCRPAGSTRPVTPRSFDVRGLTKNHSSSCSSPQLPSCDPPRLQEETHIPVDRQLARCRCVRQRKNPQNLASTDPVDHKPLWVRLRPPVRGASPITRF